MPLYIIFFISVFYFGLKAETSDQDIHLDLDLNITETIERYGYPAESHEITTEDGYIIDIFRIPHGKGGSGVNRKPIFLMHGLFGQAENYVIAGIYNASLAYHLADNDFDVWLGNSRGNQHGSRHVRLKPQSRSFRNYSWHEIGMIDVPTSIDYILEKTEMEELYYIGHSQGGTVLYIMTSMRPEYQKKIIMASLLAPAGYMGNFQNNIVSPVLKNFRILQMLNEIFYEFPPESIHLPELLSNVCSEKIFQAFCMGLYNIIAGQDSQEIRKEVLPLAIKYFASVSFRQIMHFVQSATSKHFRQWDYGTEKNLMVYGSPEPPDYPLNTIKVPIAIYYTLGDNLVNSKDIDRTCKELPNVVRKYLVPKPKFTHIDFLLASEKKLLLYPVVDFLKKYDSQNSQ